MAQKQATPSRYQFSTSLTQFILQVGVTGHRPNKLFDASSEQLQSLIGQILEAIVQEAKHLQKVLTNLFLTSPPVFRLISPLAEGADRMVAREALDKGYTLQCPLPFPRDEYEKDFDSPESRTEFRCLLGRAETVFELDGKREHAERAYLAAGRAVLGQSDVLIALWDGKRSLEKIGGTGQIVREAYNRGIPVLWIDSKSPHKVSLHFCGKNLISPRKIDGFMIAINTIFTMSNGEYVRRNYLGM